MNFVYLCLGSAAELGNQAGSSEAHVVTGSDDEDDNDDDDDDDGIITVCSSDPEPMDEGEASAPEDHRAADTAQAYQVQSAAAVESMLARVWCSAITRETQALIEYVCQTAAGTVTGCRKHQHNVVPHRANHVLTFQDDP